MVDEDEKGLLEDQLDHIILVCRAGSFLLSSTRSCQLMGFLLNWGLTNSLHGSPERP